MDDYVVKVTYREKVTGNEFTQEFADYQDFTVWMDFNYMDVIITDMDVR